MKKKFMNPEYELIELEAEDIILTSNLCSETGEVPGGEDL